MDFLNFGFSKDEKKDKARPSGLSEDKLADLKKANSAEKGEFIPANQALFSWEAPEFVYREKTKRWYTTSAIVLVIVILVALFMKNFFLIAVAVLSALLFYVYSKKQPRTVKFDIFTGGIEADNRFYDFDDLKTFWIFYNNPPDDAYVSIQTRRQYLPYLQLPMGEADPTTIREILLLFLEEKKHKEEFINVVERILKF